MSYIRALSNPESLYVYESIYGYIHWNEHSFPVNEWKQFILHIGELHFEGKHGNFELREVEMKYPTPARYKKMRRQLGAQVAKQFYKTTSHFKYNLYYKGALISRMWWVTWIYVAQKMYDEYLLEKKKHAKRNKNSRNLTGYHFMSRDTPTEANID